MPFIRLRILQADNSYTELTTVNYNVAFLANGQVITIYAVHTVAKLCHKTYSRLEYEVNIL